MDMNENTNKVYQCIVQAKHNEQIKPFYLHKDNESEGIDFAIKMTDAEVAQPAFYGTVSSLHLAEMLASIFFVTIEHGESSDDNTYSLRTDMHVSKLTLEDCNFHPSVPVTPDMIQDNYFIYEIDIESGESTNMYRGKGSKGILLENDYVQQMKESRKELSTTEDNLYALIQDGNEMVSFKAEPTSIDLLFYDGVKSREIKIYINNNGTLSTSLKVEDIK